MAKHRLSLLLLIFTATFLYGKDEDAIIQLKEFQVLNTDHFDIHFALAELEPQAQQAGKVLESAYDEFTEKLAFAPKSRISVFLYESKGAFQRSTIKSSFGQKSNNGFSEPLKNRIVLHRSPSQREDIYQLRLNLAQMMIFQNLIPEKNYKILLRYLYSEWIISGLALYLAGGDYNPRSQAIFQSNLFSGGIRRLVELKTVKHLNPREEAANIQYTIEVFRFLEDQYGVEKLRELFREMPLAFSEIFSFHTDNLLEKVYGLNEDQLHEKVITYLRAHWREEYERASTPDKWAEKLTSHETYYRHWDFGPSIAPDGRDVIFLSDRDDILNLYRLPAAGGAIEHLVHWRYGWDIYNIEGLDFLPAHSPDGKYILVKGQRKFRVAMFLVPTGKGTIQPLLDLTFDDYSGGCFAADGNAIIFVGVRAGKSDLYRYDLQLKTIQQLTSDGQSKFHPDLSPDGTKVAYIGASNLQKDIFIFDLQNQKQIHIERPESDEDFARFRSNNEIICTSNQGKFINLAHVDIDKQQWRLLSDVRDPILTLDVSSDGKWLYFAYYYDGRTSLYRVQFDKLKLLTMPQGKNVYKAPFATVSRQDPSEWSTTQYQPETTTDYLFPFLAVNAFRVSDLSGRHQFSTQFGLFTAAIFDGGGGGNDNNNGFSLDAGATGALTYKFANFFNFSLFGEFEYSGGDDDDDDDDDENDEDFEYVAGGEISVGTKITPLIEWEFGYTLFYTQEDDEDNFRLGDGTFFTGGFFIGLELKNLSTRGLDATGGYSFDVNLALFNEVFGSDFNFAEIGFDLRYYWSVVEDHILMFRVQSKITIDDVPVFLDLGGEDELRGLSTDEVEGLARAITTIEYRFPIYRDINYYCLGIIKDLRGFVFVELGAMTQDLQIDDVPDDDNTKYVPTAGFGLRLDYYLFEHFPLPLSAQVAKVLNDSGESPIIYLSTYSAF